MAFIVPQLKYSYSELEPYLAEDVVEYHYGKHTKKYFDTMNELIKGTKYEECETLDELIERRTLLQAKTVLYNNVAQAWNHQFYWSCLAPKEECGKPSDELAELIDDCCGSFDKMVEHINEKGSKHFGSGWLWLVVKSNRLNVVDTHDADNPILLEQGTPLLTIDLWEHGYYLQYKNDRVKYLDKIWNVVNWNFVNEQYRRTRPNKDDKA